MLTDKYSQQKDHKIFWKNLRSGDGSNDIIFLQLTYYEFLFSITIMKLLRYTLR